MSDVMEMMSKHRGFIILSVVLTGAFLYFLYGFTINSYRSGGGLSYMVGLDRAGLAAGARTTSDAHERIAQESEKAGVQYAIGMTLSLASNFVALLLVVGYVFGLPQLRTRRTILAGVIITGIAALCSSGVQPIIGTSVVKASQAGLGLWLAGFALFMILVTIVWGVRKFRKYVGGKPITITKSENATNERDPEEELVKQPVLKGDGGMAEDEKECPRCIEIIKLRAKYCRHCGYEYSEEEFKAEQNLIAEKVRQKIEIEKEKLETERGIT